MPDPTQYSFGYPEMAKLMFQSAGIHDGKWVVGLEINVAVAPVGLKPDEAFPGVITTISKFVLSAVGQDPTPPNLTFDASEINPRKKK